MRIKRELKRASEMLSLHLHTRVKKKFLSAIAPCNTTYMAQTTYSTGSEPQSVAVVDVNNDSKPDIIVPNQGSNTVSVLLNTGNGTFSTQTTFSTGTHPKGVAAVDVNSDNKPDIIVTNRILSLQTRVVTPLVFFSTKVTAHLVHKQITQLALYRTMWPWSM
jgi:hypothetical protein